MISKGTIKKLFFKNHSLLNKGFQDLTLTNDFKKKSMICQEQQLT
jgi:hypothetical protein